MLSKLLQRLKVAHRPGCDVCAYVEFFRSTGDGQVSRLNAFCRCPDGPYQDRPVPAARRCERWQPATDPVVKPQVGDPRLTV
jgi:hypothetical protein